MTVVDPKHDDDGVYKLSPEEMAVIQEGIAQIKNGQYLSDEEANKQIEEWLQK